MEEEENEGEKEEENEGEKEVEEEAAEQEEIAVEMVEGSHTDLDHEVGIELVVAVETGTGIGNVVVVADGKLLGNVN